MWEVLRESVGPLAALSLSEAEVTKGLISMAAERGGLCGLIPERGWPSPKLWACLFFPDP